MPAGSRVQSGSNLHVQYRTIGLIQYRGIYWFFKGEWQGKLVGIQIPLASPPAESGAKLIGKNNLLTLLDDLGGIVEAVEGGHEVDAAGQGLQLADQLDCQSDAFAGAILAGCLHALVD